mgnify:CR=1 FL=1
MEDFPKKKVCVVDDEENIREIYKTELTVCGYDVVTAIDGEDGLKIVREQKPDIVLVDIMMPRMDGVELIREIRKDETLRKTPIVVISNVEDRDIVKKTGDFDVQFYLTKSIVEPKKMVGIVAEVLERR